MTDSHARKPARKHGSNTWWTIVMMGITALALGASASHAGKTKDAVEVRPLQTRPDHVVLEIEVKDFAIKPIMIDGEKYAEISLGRESPMKQVGAPALPNICRSILIPDDAKMAVHVLASEHYDLDGINIAPSKGFISRTVNPEDVPFTFGDAYRADAFYPGKLAGLRDPYILRDHRGTVIEVNPFQYNPVQQILRVYTSLTIEVVVTGPGEVNVLKRRPQPREFSRAFDQIYSRQFLNYPVPVAQRYTPLDESGDMLIVAHDAWIPNVQPLADHKELRGIDTTIVGASSIGNDAASIKNYIQSVYDTTDLAFVLLVGDADEVASPLVTVGMETESADPTYALLAGSDHYPDILVGRFSAETAAQVDTQVLRTIEYEQLPATAQDWFKRGTGVASNEGPGDDGEYDFEHVDNIRTDLLAYDYTVVDQIYDPGASASDVTNALNAGRGIVNYTGHGSPYGWGTTGFSNSNVNALTNDNMLPFILSVACNNGTFDGYTCFAETWLRATNGSEPTGAIAMYASSVSQHWNPPMCAQDEIVDLLVAESYTSFGTLCFAGSCQMMDEYGTGGVEMYDTWHVFGDPSVRVFNRCLDAGTIGLDRDAYRCESEAVMAVADCGLNLSDTAVETVTVTVASDSESGGEGVLLTETGAASALFEGAVTLSVTDAAGVLLVAEGDTVTATYIDADDGSGGGPVEVTATAVVDCQPPQISNVQTSDVWARGATVTFDADEPVLGIVHYGTNCETLTAQTMTGTYATVVTVELTGLTDETTYFYAVEAQDKAGNASADDNGGACYTFTTPDVPDFFTEMFGIDNDLSNLAIELTPNGSDDFYSGCAYPITALPTDPAGGTELLLADDDYTYILLDGGKTVSLYSTAHSTFYVGSNGYITFNGADINYIESLENHFSMPRVSALFDDLNPPFGGEIRWQQLEDRVAVTWLNVREYGYTTTNTFQIELYFDGVIRMSYLDISAQDGLAGLSAGLGLDPGFLETDLSALDECMVDCNENGIPDDEDIVSGTSEDCNENGIPDECETDCNDNGVPDDCDISSGTSPDCNNNGAPDECDIADGTSVDSNDNGIPDECECPPAYDPQPEPWKVLKNRYLSFVPGNPGVQTALRLTFADLPVPFDILDGATMWVGEPRTVSEHSATVDPEEAPEWPTCILATLQCEPLYMDWSTQGTIHVYHEYIIPGAMYDVQAIVEGCNPYLEELYSVPLELITSMWGDVVKDCSTQPCGPPDGIVGVTTDVTALLDKFKNISGSPVKPRSDIEPARPDQIINITDVTFAIDAFRGQPYPFAPPVSGNPCLQ